MTGLGLSVYYPPGTPQNPTPPPEPPPPPPEIQVPKTATAAPGWWSSQSPTVRYAVIGGGALLAIGVVVAVAKK
jgi:hypothetical protein